MLAQKLTGLSPSELADVVGVRVPLAAKGLAITSIALCWTPGFSLLLGALAVVANWKGKRWKTLSLVGSGLRLIINLVYGFFLLALPSGQGNTLEIALAERVDRDPVRKGRLWCWLWFRA